MRFAIPIPYFFDSTKFKIIIQNQCVKNIITGVPLSDQKYFIGGPNIFLKSSPWNITDEYCRPLVFKVILADTGRDAPSFIRFDPSIMVFTISTQLIAYVGTYRLSLRGTTNLFDRWQSTFLQPFKLTISC